MSSFVLSALHFHVPGVPLQPYPSSHTQYPSWDTKPMIPRSSVPFSTFVTFIPTFFVRLTSVCMSYPKLSQQLKWKSSLYPGSDLRAITSDSLRHRCHVCCSLENLMVVFPFSPRFLTQTLNLDDMYPVIQQQFYKSERACKNGNDTIGK